MCKPPLPKNTFCPPDKPKAPPGPTWSPAVFPFITNHFWHNASVKLQRTDVKLVIGALQGQQLFVCAAFDNAPVVQHHDGI